MSCLTFLRGKVVALVAVSSLAAAVADPASFDGLQVWLDAGTGIVDTDGDLHVERWEDRSGNGRDAVGATGGDPKVRPLYIPAGVPALNNQPLLEWLNHPGCLMAVPTGVNFNANSYTLSFVVGGSPEGGTYFSTAGMRIERYYGSDRIDYLNDSGEVVTRVGVSSFGDNAVVTVRQNGDELSVYSNGVYVGGAVNVDRGAVSDQEAHLGHDKNDGLRFKAMMGEFVIYDRALDDYERAKVENYLGEKYLAGSLNALGEIDSDEDGVPDEVEAVVGTERQSAASVPNVAIPTKWEYDGTAYVEYDFSGTGSEYVHAEAVPVVAEDGVLEGDLMPVVEVREVNDPDLPIFTPPPGTRSIGKAFEVYADIAAGRTIRFSLPLPNMGLYPLREQDLQVHLNDGSGWESKDVTLRDGYVTFETAHFSTIRLTTATGKVLLVDNTYGNDQNDGSTWATAFKHLDRALAAGGSSVEEIWVTKGIHKHSSGSSTGTFTIPAGVAVLGGFKPVAEVNGVMVGEEYGAYQYPRSNETILSGDVGVVGDPIDNARTIVQMSSNSVLDGFTIEGGQNDMYEGGGAVSVLRVVNFAIRRCVLRNNYAVAGGGMAIEHSSGTVEDCVIEANVSHSYGAGAFLQISSGDNGSLTFLRCTFKDNVPNSSTSSGGGVSFLGSSPNYSVTFESCVFTGNHAAGGGAISAEGKLYLNNCTISGNSAGGYQGTFVAAGGVDAFDATVKNCILWGNTCGAASPIPPTTTMCQLSGTLAVSYSCVEDGAVDGTAHPGTGNIDQDPLFVNAAQGDFYLQANSPCIDVGSAVDLKATDRYGMFWSDENGVSKPDLGAYDRKQSFAEVNLDTQTPKDPSKQGEVLLADFTDNAFSLDNDWDEEVPQDESVQQKLYSIDTPPARPFSRALVRKVSEAYLGDVGFRNMKWRHLFNPAEGSTEANLRKHYVEKGQDAVVLVFDGFSDVRMKSTSDRIKAQVALFKRWDEQASSLTALGPDFGHGLSFEADELFHNGNTQLKANVENNNISHDSPDRYWSDPSASVAEALGYYYRVVVVWEPYAVSDANSDKTKIKYWAFDEYGDVAFSGVNDVDVPLLEPRTDDPQNPFAVFDEVQLLAKLSLRQNEVSRFTGTSQLRGDEVIGFKRVEVRVMKKTHFNYMDFQPSSQL